jgi:hypothetical protein
MRSTLIFFRHLLSFFFLCLIINFTYAQTSPTIATGRPGQSIGARVVGTHILQLQSGIELNRVETGATKDESWINNNVVRYGINEKVELSGVLDYRIQDSAGSGLDNYQFGFPPFAFKAECALKEVVILSVLILER